MPVNLVKFSSLTDINEFISLLGKV